MPLLKGGYGTGKIIMDNLDKFHSTYIKQCVCSHHFRWSFENQSGRIVIFVNADGSLWDNSSFIFNSSGNHDFSMFINEDETLKELFEMMLKAHRII